MLILAVAMIAVAHAQVKTEVIEYKDGETVLEGYLAYDASIKEKRPAVIVVHEWMGINDYTKKRCEQLAALGYVAFAADIYGKGVRPQKPEEAGKEAAKYKGNRALMRSRMNAALDWVKKSDKVKSDQVAAIGYCFGGTAVLELARSGADVKGVVSLHGGLDTPTPQDAKNIKARVLACHGALDPFVPQKDVEAFKKEMDEAKVDYMLIIYSGAVHAFTNPNSGNDPSKGAAYNKKADERSWEHMKLFLTNLFEG